MMAHPKIDPKTGELIFYSYFGPDFSYFIADRNGKITRQEKITMPFECMMHDFAIMPKHGNVHDVIWFEDQAAMGFHVANAREV